VTSSQKHRFGTRELARTSHQASLRTIDRVLAAHYGFTEEELDFIINYDINYRMGREAESEEDLTVAPRERKGIKNLS